MTTAGKAAAKVNCFFTFKNTTRTKAPSHYAPLKMLRATVIILGFTVFTGCREKRVSNQTQANPHVDTVLLHNVDSLNEAFGEFMGKFNHRDSIQFVNLDSVNYEGVFVDTSLAELDKISNATDSFKVIGYCDRRIQSAIRSDSFWYYPVYVYNKSRCDKFFVLKDDYVYAIQEAIHPDGNWYPIEKRPMDDCLNGKWSIRVKPEEFVVFLMNKYQGDFKTNIRVRLKIGRTIYYSEPMEGSINLEQFIVKNFKADFNSDSSFVKDFLFYGATPLQVLN